MLKHGKGIAVCLTTLAFSFAGCSQGDDAKNQATGNLIKDSYRLSGSAKDLARELEKIGSVSEIQDPAERKASLEAATRMSAKLTRQLEEMLLEAKKSGVVAP